MWRRHRVRKFKPINEHRGRSKLNRPTRGIARKLGEVLAGMAQEHTHQPPAWVATAHGWNWNSKARWF